MEPACYRNSSVNSEAGGQSPIEYQPVITSPGGHPNKDGRTRDSSSALMRVHQSSFPMDDRMTNTTTVCIHPQSLHGPSRWRWLAGIGMRKKAIPPCMICGLFTCSGPNKYWGQWQQPDKKVSSYLVQADSQTSRVRQKMIDV